MSWVKFQKDYEKLLVKEIAVEEKFNPVVPGRNKHRFIADIVIDKAEEKVNFGFERFNGANPDRLKILKYTLNKVQSQNQENFIKSKIRPSTYKPQNKLLHDEFFITK